MRPLLLLRNSTEVSALTFNTGRSPPVEPIFAVLYIERALSARVVDEVSLRLIRKQVCDLN